MTLAWPCNFEIHRQEHKLGIQNKAGIEIVEMHTKCHRARKDTDAHPGKGR